MCIYIYHIYIYTTCTGYSMHLNTVCLRLKQSQAAATGLWNVETLDHRTSTLIIQKREWGRTTNWHTLQETNISHPKALLKIIFLFQRWDMLVAWRVWFVWGSKNNNNMSRSGLECVGGWKSLFWGVWGGVSWYPLRDFVLPNKKRESGRRPTAWGTSIWSQTGLLTVLVRRISSRKLADLVPSFDYIVGWGGLK